MFARLIIDKQDIARPTTKQFFVVPKNDFFLFEDEMYVSTNEHVQIIAL